MSERDPKAFVLLENRDEKGTEWGVSLNGPNPDVTDFIRCPNKLAAVKLIDLLRAWPAVSDVFAAAVLAEQEK